MVFISFWFRRSVIWQQTSTHVPSDVTVRSAPRPPRPIDAPSPTNPLPSRMFVWSSRYSLQCSSDVHCLRGLLEHAFRHTFDSAYSFLKIRLGSLFCGLLFGSKLGSSMIIRLFVVKKRKVHAKYFGTVVVIITRLCIQISVETVPRDSIELRRQEDSEERKTWLKEQIKLAKEDFKLSRGEKSSRRQKKGGRQTCDLYNKLRRLIRDSKTHTSERNDKRRLFNAGLKNGDFLTAGDGPFRGVSRG